MGSHQKVGFSVFVRGNSVNGRSVCPWLVISNRGLEIVEGRVGNLLMLATFHDVDVVIRGFSIEA